MKSKTKKLTIIIALIISMSILSSITTMASNPTGPTDGIVSNKSYVLRNGTRYFGFTTGEPLCDFEPTDQNTEFQIRYYGNGKYDLMFSNSQRYGWLYAHPASDSVTVAPSQCYWYIIKNANGKYTIALADDPTKVLTVVHVTALNQMQVKLQTLGSVSSSLQEWEIINYSAHIDVDLFYDTGFRIFYGEGSDSQSATKIRGIANQSRELFLDQFGVYLSVNSASYKASNCDVCKNPTTAMNINNQCQHYTSYTDKHTYWQNVGRHFAENNPLSNYKQKQALFVGSYTFLENGSISGLACSYPPSMGNLHGHLCMMKIYNKNVYDNTQAVVYAHEMAHQFNAIDHYCSFAYDNNGVKYCVNGAYCSQEEHTDTHQPRRPDDCIMDNILDEDKPTRRYQRHTFADWYNNNVPIFCDACIGEIKSWIDQHYN